MQKRHWVTLLRLVGYGLLLVGVFVVSEALSIVATAE